MPQITIRPAAAPDAALILGFIQDLAAYEKLSHEARATEADIARDLFGPHPKVFCEIALDGDGDGDEAVGFALWFYTYSTFAGAHGLYLEDLFVRQSARGRGAGLALMAALARRCVAEKLGRLQWAVLDWNAPALDFYAKLGARQSQGWLDRRLEGEALTRLAELGA